MKENKTEGKATDDDISNSSDYEVLPIPSNFDEMIIDQENKDKNILLGNNEINVVSKVISKLIMVIF